MTVVSDVSMSNVSSVLHHICLMKSRKNNNLLTRYLYLPFELVFSIAFTRPCYSAQQLRRWRMEKRKIIIGNLARVSHISVRVCFNIRGVLRVTCQFHSLPAAYFSWFFVMDFHFVLANMLLAFSSFCLCELTR